MRTIKLTQGKVALVDDCDYDYLMQWQWYYTCGYAYNNKMKYMHRLILDRIGYRPKKLLNLKDTLDYRHEILRPPLNQSPGPKKISLTQGKFAIVDAENYEFLMQFNWCCHKGYATRRCEGRTQYMHKVVLERAGLSGEEIDHIDGNRANNLLENLRPVTRQQNCMNQSPQIGNSSKYKGVCWDKNAYKWVVGIKINGKRKALGHYTGEEEAARVYNAAAIELFGEYARLNEIENENTKVKV